MKVDMKTFKILILLCSLSCSLVFAQSQGTRFQGFSRGQSGAGVLLGSPMSARYQRWLDWKTATFFSVGYSFEKFIMADANYAHYFLTEDDRWRNKEAVGAIMYSAFAGVTGGTYVGTATNEKARLGVRAGGAFEYLLPESKWTIRLEIAPVLFLSGKTTAGVQGGVGVIYYFDQEKVKKQKYSSEVRGGVDKSIIEGEQGADIHKQKRKKKKKKKIESNEEELDL